MRGPPPTPARGRARAGWLFALAACASAPRASTPEVAPDLVAPAQAPASEAAASDLSAPPGVNGALPLPREDDTSLELTVYRAAGVPALERPWSVEDYQRCLDVLMELLHDGRRDLPRAGSPRSGQLFARLVDAANFDAAPPSSSDEPARRLQGYLGVFPGLLRMYSPASDGRDFSREQTALIVALLELLSRALPASLEQSARDASAASEYEQQRQVTLGVLRGTASMLAEPERYAAPLRRHLREQLARLGPALEPHLPPETPDELRAALRPGG